MSGRDELADVIACAAMDFLLTSPNKQRIHAFIADRVLAYLQSDAVIERMARTDKDWTDGCYRGPDCEECAKMRDGCRDRARAAVAALGRADG